MKWAVTLLVVLNIMLGIAAINWSPPGKQAPAGGEGRLPRVADLKLNAAPKPRESEPASSSSPERPLANEYNEQAPPRGSQKRICGRMTGFQSRAAAEHLLRSIGVTLQTVAIEKVEDERPPYHWVLIPPFPSREGALKRLEELQRAGVDSFLVTEGAYRNAISLGLFESQKLAEDLNARFQSRNIETVLVNTDRNQISYALVFAVASKADFDRFLNDAKRVPGDLPSVEKAACEGVASPDKNP
ncbi:SPOR domain-containing protein [Marinobacter mangrovi]|uniref:SPOR domain-containing protein n=1 Tax=Marinobacter mangrovi TaxID=2803918 RepID=UPI0019323AE5|nr:SPOR domain-containing protein [Marinobacter mangrovi]